MMRSLTGNCVSPVAGTEPLRALPTTLTGLRQQVKRLLVSVRRNVPPGFRWIVGLALMVGGVFGFLPILGFWMIPLGVAVFLLDFNSLRKWWRDNQRH